MYFSGFGHFSGQQQVWLPSGQSTQTLRLDQGSGGGWSSFYWLFSPQRMVSTMRVRGGAPVSTMVSTMAFNWCDAKFAEAECRRRARRWRQRADCQPPSPRGIRGMPGGCPGTRAGARGLQVADFWFSEFRRVELWVGLFLGCLFLWSCRYCSKGPSIF